MNLRKIEETWGMARGLLLVALILIIAGWAVCGYCYTFEMDYTGPGSEFERSMEQYRDNENREAAEREGNGTATDRDHEKADQYRDDHGV